MSVDAVRVGAVVLAAGGSTRMGGRNKLLEEIDGAPVVVHAVRAALAACAPERVMVVTGHQEREVRKALVGLPVQLASNPRWREGMSTSLVVGLSALAERLDGALICLGDMPRVAANDTRALVAALGAAHASGAEVAPAYVPVHEGRQGNPVLWSARWFPELRALTGDRGARALLAELGNRVARVPAGEGVLRDVDTPGEMERLRGGGREL